MPDPLATEPGFTGGLDQTVAYQADIKARPAGVTGDHVPVSQFRPRIMEGSHRREGWAGTDAIDGTLG